MSQNFKLKFDEMRQGNPVAQDTEDGTPYKTYGTEGHVRNICFEWPDGKMKFLNYAYLVSGEYNPDESKITLTFTSEIVIVSGNNLGALFVDLINHIPKLLSYSDDRYSGLKDGQDVVIKEITISMVH